MKVKIYLKLAVIIVLVMTNVTSALTQCVTPFEEGTWYNIDKATRGITKIEVKFSCNDVIRCSVDQNGQVKCTEPGPPYQLHLWGKCHPSDCDWSTTTGNDHYVGSTKWIYSYYDQGFAKRYVYIKPSSIYPGKLYLWMYTQFTDPSRPGYVFKGWYKK